MWRVVDFKMSLVPNKLKTRFEGPYPDAEFEAYANLGDLSGQTSPLRMKSTKGFATSTSTTSAVFAR